MNLILTIAAIVVGYGVWWLAPTAQTWFGLGWTADLGQICLVILVLSLLGKLEGRLAGRAGHTAE